MASMNSIIFDAFDAATNCFTSPEGPRICRSGAMSIFGPLDLPFTVVMSDKPMGVLNEIYARRDCPMGCCFLTKYGLLNLTEDQFRFLRRAFCVGVVHEFWFALK